MRTLWRYLSLLRFVCARLLAQRALTISLLCGWVACVALTAAIPMYTDAANQQLLSRELAKQPGRSPAYAFHFRYAGGSTAGATWERYDALRQYMASSVQADMGLPQSLNMHYVRSDLFSVFTTNEQGAAHEALTHGDIGFVRDLEQHITLLEGRLPQPNQDSSGPLEVLLSRALQEKYALQLGDELILFAQERSTDSGVRKRFQVTVRVVGVWTAKDPDSDFWYLSPTAFDNTFLLPEDTYVSLAQSGRLPYLLYTVGWYQVYNGASVRAQDVPGFLGRVGRVQYRVDTLLPGMGIDLSPVPALLRYQRAAVAQAVQLSPFLIPFIAMVIYFIVIVANGAVASQRVEIAMLRSRGASGGQIIFTYVLQAILMGAVAMVLGPPLGQLIARAIGSIRGFLVFTAREPLNVAITPLSLQFGLLALLGALIATLSPAIAAAQASVVVARVGMARSSPPPFWQRFYMDILLLAVSGYGYHLLQGQGRLALLRSSDSGDPLTNPLLFLGPALFILAASMLCVRIFPWLLRIPAWLASRGQGVSLLLALNNLTRGGYTHMGLLLILVLTTGWGAFTASAAHTIDDSTVSRIRYRTGADVVLTEGMAVENAGGQESSLAQTTADNSSSDTSSSPLFFFAPVEDHLQAPGVRAVARVARFKGQVRAGSFLQGQVFGVDRASFAQVAYFRPDFARDSLGALMNALALHYDGVLVSEDVLAQTGLQIGDPLPIQGLISTGSQAVTFTIVGALRYFPTALPQNGPIFVANLDYIFEQLGGEKPYNIWLSVQDGTDLPTLLKNLDAIGYRILSSQDAQSQIDQVQQQPERIGLFGFLSVGFAITVGLSTLAQLIYALLSLRQRFIQFGIIRAIGLSAGQLALSVTTEVALIACAGIGVGLGVGLLSSYLFIPFLQVGYNAADLVPPFVLVIAWGDILKAMVALIVASVLTDVIVIAFLRRVQVFVALKLGETWT